MRPVVAPPRGGEVSLIFLVLLFSSLSFCTLFRVLQSIAFAVGFDDVHAVGDAVE